MFLGEWRSVLDYHSITIPGPFSNCCCREIKTTDGCIKWLAWRNGRNRLNIRFLKNRMQVMCERNFTSSFFQSVGLLQIIHFDPWINDTALTVGSILLIPLLLGCNVWNMQMRAELRMPSENTFFVVVFLGHSRPAGQTSNMSFELKKKTKKQKNSA